MYCEECNTGFSENCYRDKSCIFYRDLGERIDDNNDICMMYSYFKKIYDEGSPIQIFSMCASCIDGKPVYCRYSVPKCIDSKIGHNVCKKCANGKRDKCLRLTKCEFPEKYVNRCNICYYTAYNVADYRQHVKSKKHKRKAEKQLSELSFHEHKELIRRDYLKPVRFNII